jgi:putative ABC transport system permease protein
MRIPLLSGELCREPQAAMTIDRHLDFKGLNVLVNRSFINTYLRGESAIGRHVSLVGNSFLGPDHAGEIRGIVGDAREEGMNHQPGPTLYWCFGAPGGPDPYYAARTRTEPMAMAETVRQKIHEIEPHRSVFDITPLQQHIDDAFAENRLRTILLTFFAVTAISLACVGLYGTLSYSVNNRQREIGLRLALGAVRGQIVKHFLLQGVAVTLLGCVAGWGFAAASSRLLAEMLYGVSATDITTMVSVAVLVLFVAAAASLIPALRAARLDPMQVLREE